MVDIGGQEERKLFSQSFSCPDCGISIDELQPRLFSFNNPFGACPECTGLGMQMKFDPDLIIPNRDLSLAQGAIVAPGWGSAGHDDSYAGKLLSILSKKYGFRLDVPVRELSPEAMDILLNGTGAEKVNMVYEGRFGTREYSTPFAGLLGNEVPVSGVQRIHEGGV